MTVLDDGTGIPEDMGQEGGWPPDDGVPPDRTGGSLIVEQREEEETVGSCSVPLLDDRTTAENGADE